MSRALESFRDQEQMRGAKIAGATIGLFAGLAVFAIFMWILGPFLLLWAINTLFSLDLAYLSFWNWLAAFVLIALFGRTACRSKP